MTTNTKSTKSTKSTNKGENVEKASEASEASERGTEATARERAIAHGMSTMDNVDAILANVAGYDETATRAAFNTALVALEQVESGAIIGTIRARAAIGAVSERLYVLQHGKAGSVSAVAGAVPEDVRQERSESFVKLCVRTHRLHTPTRYVRWSDVRDVEDVAKSDPAAFKPNADAYLRWCEADNDKRTDASGAVLAPSAKSNRSGTSTKPAPIAGETTAAYRQRLAAAEQAKRAEHAARVMSVEKVGGIKLTTFQSMPDAALADVIILCQTILAEREAAAKVAAAAAEQAKQAQDNVADVLKGLSADDLAKLVALVKSA